MTASAGNLTVAVDSFMEPAGGFSVGDSIPFRFAELSGVPAGDNSATHVIIEGLTVLDGQVYRSNYSAVDINNEGAIEDVGVLYLEMPSADPLPEGTVASPIVGVVERVGAWDNYTPTAPSTTVGGSSGASTYDAETGALSLNLLRGAEVFTGTAAYAVVDEDTLDLEAFTLVKDGLTSYAFGPTTLVRDGNRYYGTLASTDTAPGFDSLLFEVQLLDLPDVDTDGVPDLTDAQIDDAGLVLEAGWQFVAELGWTYGYSASAGYSVVFGQIYTAEFPSVYLYNGNWGWVLHVTPIGEKDHYYFSQDLGWVYVNTDFGGWFQYSGGDWAFDNFITPQNQG